MCRRPLPHADATPTVRKNQLEHSHDSIARLNIVSPEPVPFGLSANRAGTRLDRSVRCESTTASCRGTLRGSQRAPASLWAGRIIHHFLPPVPRRTHGGRRRRAPRTEIPRSGIFGLAGASAGNPPLAMARSIVRRSHGSGASVHTGSAIHHFVRQRRIVALEARSLVCTTRFVQHARKDLETCQ